MQTAVEFPELRKFVIRIKHSQVILAIIILIFFSDGVNSILVAVGAPFYRVSILFRSVALIYFLMLALLKSPKNHLLLIVLFFYTIFMIGLISAQHLFEEYNYLENFNLINKLLFFFICWVAFNIVFQSDKDRIKLFKLYELIILFEVMSILIGFIFQIDFLSSYGGRRFGYKGLIPAQNEVSGFFILALFYYLAKVNYLGRDVLKLIMVLIAGLLTGTKVALVMPLVLVIQVIFWLTRQKVKIRYLHLAISLLFIVAGAIYYWDDLLTTISPTIEYYTYQVTNYDYSPFVIIGTSGRLLLVEEFLLDYLPRYNSLNLLFGGQDLAFFSTETDIIDVFMRLGIIGLLVFYSIYIRVLIGNSVKVDFIRLLFVITWLGISAVAGHFVFSAINGGYLAILLLAFRYYKGVQRSNLENRNNNHVFSRLNIQEG
ncbi:MAG: O-antigen ligase family protein [Bacteroidales bacterium]|nr:O-antigen ligase family protein [Bacteroidales bacterium]